MNLLYRITGGRPMKRQSLLFVDRISGESVCHYIDRLGRHWMATGAWSQFRVEKEPT